LSRLEKLIEKARKNPKNFKFSELRRLCELIGMVERNSGGSHVVYKRSNPPRHTIPIQDDNGMAKSYQVKQLLQFIDDHDLLKKGK
jgi:predicted RNA binding protein YcfA (HicA-like mRNA interferase family)